MYLIKVENFMYCVYATNNNNIIAKFARLSDATRYIQYLYGQNHVIDNNTKMLINNQKQLISSSQNQEINNFNKDLSSKNILKSIDELNKKVNLALEANEVIMNEIDEIKNYFSDLMR